MVQLVYHTLLRAELKGTNLPIMHDFIMSKSAKQPCMKGVFPYHGSQYLLLPHLTPSPRCTVFAANYTCCPPSTLSQCIGVALLGLLGILTFVTLPPARCSLSLTPCLLFPCLALLPGDGSQLLRRLAHCVQPVSTPRRNRAFCLSLESRRFGFDPWRNLLGCPGSASSSLSLSALPNPALPCTVL